MEKSINFSRRSFLQASGVIVAGIALSPWKLFAQDSPVTMIIGEAKKSTLQITKLRNNLYLIEGSGGNIVVSTGKDGKFLVDGGIDVSKEKMRKALADISASPLKMLVNTHWHFDHTSGNEWLHADGAKIIAHPNTKKHLSKTTRVDDWNYTFSPSPKGALPEVLVADSKSYDFNSDNIAIAYYGPAHTDSDLNVFFENANLLHVADTWWNGFYPFIDLNTGGSINGMINAANKNIAMADNETIVVPGHGPVGKKQDLVEYRDMLVDLKNKVSSLKSQGKKLDEVIAAKPTQQYDSKWGNFVIKGDLFASLIYRSL